MEALGELERLQTKLLQRISKLELSYLPQHHSISSPIPTSTPIDEPQADTESRLSTILLSNGVDDFSFKRVPSNYYDWPLEARRDALGAASVDHLCKSIVLVNTQAQSNVIDCRDRNNSKYYLAVVQYTARFNAEAVKHFLYSLNNGNIAKKKFNLRLAPEETSAELTGFVRNAVTCIGMKTDIPSFFFTCAFDKDFPDISSGWSFLFDVCALMPYTCIQPVLLRCKTEDPLVFCSVPYVGHMMTTSMYDLNPSSLSSSCVAGPQF